MKKLIALLLACTLALSLAACGGGEAASTTAKDFKQILTDSRTAEDNENIAIVTSPEEDEYGLMELYGLDPALMERYAVSISPVNLVAHAVMIVQPTSSGAEDVKKAMQGFIEKQLASFKDYLPDQYAVAEAAKLENGPSGELILVMCEDADAVMSSIQTALKG